MVNYECKRCLILQADYRPKSLLPLSTISWQSAIRLSFLKKIKVIEWYDDVVRSPTLTMKIPAVAVIKKYYHNYKKEIMLTKHNIFLRDVFTCQYCLNVFEPKNLTIDHVIPTSKNGSHSWENLTTSCLSCNLKKGNSIGIYKPHIYPFKPDNNLLINRKQKLNHVLLHESWKDYI